MLATRTRAWAFAAIAAAAAAAAVAAAVPVRAADLGGAPSPVGDAPTTAPSRTALEISTDLRSTAQELRAATPEGTLADPAKRSAAAPTVVPLLKTEMRLMDELAASREVPAAQRAAVTKQLSQQKQQFAAMLYLFADKPTVDRIDAAPADDVSAQSVKLQSRWIAAGRHADAQDAIAAELQKLDAAHTDDEGLTTTTVTLAMAAVSPATKQQLLDTATKTMKNPMATRYGAMVKSMEQQQQAQSKQKDMEGKPLTVAATTVDGKPFTSADYKGKVVLVDFWATWCGPCVAGLPEVKELYAKYHDKGLEIVGVSNDYSPEKLKSFTAKNDMPWVQLYDAAAGADHQWNPVTLGYGIHGIPTLFLIDKKGVLRTVEARSTMVEEIPKLLAE